MKIAERCVWNAGEFRIVGSVREELVAGLDVVLMIPDLTEGEEDVVAPFLVVAFVRSEPHVVRGGRSRGEIRRHLCQRQHVCLAAAGIRNEVERVRYCATVDLGRRAADVNGLGQGGSGHVPTAEELCAAIGGPWPGVGNCRKAGNNGAGVERGDGGRVIVPYLTTVGVPVALHPGMDTEVYPDNDGSPTSAPGLTSKFGFSIGSADAGTVFIELTSMATAPSAPDTRRKRLSTRQSPLWAPR
jgi:hypothetical protein